MRVSRVPVKSIWAERDLIFRLYKLDPTRINQTSRVKTFIGSKVFYNMGHIRLTLQWYPNSHLILQHNLFHFIFPDGSKISSWKYSNIYKYIDLYLMLSIFLNDITVFIFISRASYNYKDYIISLIWWRLWTRH